MLFICVELFDFSFVSPSFIVGTFKKIVSLSSHYLGGHHKRENST